MRLVAYSATTVLIAGIIPDAQSLMSDTLPADAPIRSAAAHNIPAVLRSKHSRLSGAARCDQLARQA